MLEAATAQEETVSVTFKPGWNFFALPVIPEDGAVSVLLPSFAQDFEQIAKFEPATNAYQHYVGNPKFDAFTELEYGVGYQLYCKASSDITIPLKGKLPTKSFSKSLATGWHLLPAITLQDAATLASVFSGLSYDQLLRYDPAASPSLAAATTLQKGQAYFVRLTAAAPAWSPPIPRNVTTTFVYDGDGGKVKQLTASGTTTYVGELVEKDTTGTTKYVFAGSQRLVAKDSTGALRFYHGDHLGSSNVITDGTGQLVELAEYTPFGAVSAQSPQPAAPSPFGFTGQRQDMTNGLILFPARTYDPQLGRFLQPDPFVQDPSDPQTLNRYAYVRNNPVNLVDPSGFGFRSWLRTIFAAVAAVVTAIVAPEASPFVFAAIAGTAAISGDQVGAAIDRSQARSNSQTSFQSIVPQLVPSSPVSAALGLGLASSGATSPTRSFPLLSEAEIAASDLPLEDSWGPDDVIFVLTGLGVSARAAMTAARELGPAVLGGLRALGETGAIRVGKPLTTNVATEVSEAVLGGNAKTVVIGETMDRVKGYARSIGAKWYQAWRIEPFDEALALKRNERWIRGVIRKGYRIIDMGIDSQRAVRSKFYGLERRIIEELGYAVTRR